MGKTSINVMIWTVCVLSIERYVAICHPFLASKYNSSSKSRAVKTLIGIWLLEFLCNTLFIIYIVVVHHARDPSVTVCVHAKKFRIYLYGLESMLFFFLPMIMVFIMHTLIVLELRKSVKEIGCINDTTDHSKQRAPKILSKNFQIFFL